MTKFIFFLQVFFAILLVNMAAAGKSTENSAFATDIFNRISTQKPSENVIMSPVSIQTCLAMGLFGAEGKTATEIATGLHFATSNKEEIAAKFEKLLKSNTNLVHIANKLYANNLYEIKSEFNAVAQKTFSSEAQTLDFSKSSEAVKTINGWVESKTNNKIQNLLSDGSVDGETRMILVNAIYFKGEWVNQFEKHVTHNHDFWTNETNKVSVQMMMNDDRFKYGEFPDLDATAIEMPYKDSDLSMMVILPKKRNGLMDLMSKLQNNDFLDMSAKMESEDVDIRLPKFKVEFDLNLNEVLQSMGMKTMYSDSANFSGIFKSTTPVKISDVVHKAFINVDEAGSEAAAATFMKIVPMSLNLDKRSFIADHPFVYLIKDGSSVYFVGHIVKL